MWEMNHRENWALKEWCIWSAGLEKILASPLDWKEIKPVHPKGNQPWIFIGRTDAEAEAPILWPPKAKSWLIDKEPDAGKDWRQEEKGVTEDEIIGWHHWLDGHEFEQTLGDSEGQGSLVCCSLWGCKESDTTEQVSIHVNTIIRLITQVRVISVLAVLTFCAGEFFVMHCRMFSSILSIQPVDVGEVKC